MRSLKYFLCLLIFSASLLQAQEAYRFFINNINLPVNNYGILADVNIPPDGSLGKFNDIGFLFSGGFLISGYKGDSLWANGVVSTRHLLDYLPGPVGSDPSSAQNIIYVVSADDPPFGPSWQDWKNAVA